MERIDLNKLSITEIKALIYDQSLKMGRIRESIAILEQELNNRMQQRNQEDPEILLSPKE